MRNLSFKNACKLSLILLISASFVLQTNITKPLAETLTSLATPSPLVDTLEEEDGSLVTPDDPDQAILPDNPQATTKDLSQSAMSESALLAETPQTDTLEAAFAWNPSTNVLTIQGDCKASDIKNEIASEASAAHEVCFSGAVTITTDQGTSSPFSGATNLERITALGDTHVSFAAAAGTADATLRNFFNGRTNLASIDGLSSWDVSNVSGEYCMSYMFYSCTALTSLDGIASWDISSATGPNCLSHMFQRCTSLTSLDGLGSWNVSNVTGDFCMYHLFDGCTSLTSLDGIAAWNVSSVSGPECMSHMFYGCTSLTTLDGISSWDVSSVTGIYCMEAMFRNCEALTSLDGLASWDVSSVSGSECMASMFYGCTSLSYLDGLASWDVSNVSGEGCMNSMFYGCKSLTSLEGIASWDVSNVSGKYCMYGMFEDCSSLTSLEGIASWDVSSVSGNYCMQSMFRDCASLTSLDGLGSWDVSKISGNGCMDHIFGDCTNLQDITAISSWNLAKAKSSTSGIYNMFNGCSNITYIRGASTDAAGFVPTGFMSIRSLVALNNFYSEQAPTTPVPGNTLLSNWSTYAAQGTWTWKQTVTFNANGGAGAPAPKLVVHNAYATQPTPEQNPTRAGFYFAGWTTDTAGTTRFDFAHTKLASDITLYAQWSAHPVFTVVFNTTGGSLEDTQYIVQGHTATRPTVDPTRADYTFVDWYTDETGTTLFDFANPISTNTVAYAKWASNTLTATFDLNGGEGTPPAAITLSYGEVFPTDKKPADPTRTGYSFEGWYTEATEGSKMEWGTTTVTQTADFVLYAHWTAAPSPSDGEVSEDVLLPQTGDATSALLPLLFISAALGLFAGSAVFKGREC